MRKGLSLKPSLTFLFPLLNRRRIQLKNLDNMASGFKRSKIGYWFPGGKDLPARTKPKIVDVGNSAELHTI
jgi:hypothetical protein